MYSCPYVPAWLVGLKCADRKGEDQESARWRMAYIYMQQLLAVGAAPPSLDKIVMHMQSNSTSALAGAPAALPAVHRYSAIARLFSMHPAMSAPFALACSANMHMQ